jgi:hypothetical protein
MGTVQTRARNLAQKSPVFRRPLVAFHDTFLDRSSPISYKIMRGICRFDTLRRIVLAFKRERVDHGCPRSELIQGGSRNKSAPSSAGRGLR